MALTFTRTFRVRHYECDPYAHVNNANYLRYMQETAFDASAAAGYDLKRYDEMERSWLIRQTEIEYLVPLRYGDTIEAKTWVHDFKRITSRRDYELRIAESGELAARAWTEWVFMNTRTGQPARIPAEMVAAFFPEDAATAVPSRERFPEQPQAPPGVFRTRRRVAWHDLDPAGHVNNAVYLNYVEDAGMQVIAAFRWPLERMWEEGFAIIARRNRIEYLQSAQMNDELELATWVSQVKRATAVRHYSIARVSDGALLARVDTLGVWVSLKTGQPTRIPPDFVQDFEPNLVMS